MSYDTVQDYITDARVLLQDQVIPYRYADAELVVALNAALLETRRLRADLFIGFMENIPQYLTNDDTTVPIEQPFRLPIVYGVCGHALMRDQEDIQDARASMFMKAFRVMLTGSTDVLNAQGGSA
jgi:hypothetical protein